MCVCVGENKKRNVFYSLGAMACVPQRKREREVNIGRGAEAWARVYSGEPTTAERAPGGIVRPLTHLYTPRAAIASDPREQQQRGLRAYLKFTRLWIFPES